jgi:lysophospholipase L1-like esterase
MCRLTFLFFTCFLFLSSLQAQDNQKPFFKDGDVICFLGDSITHGGQYHQFLQLFYATRYPAIKLSFHNCGISGDNTLGMIERFEKDVLKHNPTHVFLMTGMNDVIRTLYFEGKASQKILKQREDALATYKQNTALLAEKIITNGVIPIFLTPSIYDQYSQIEKENNLGCNDALIECAKHIKDLAKKYNSTVVDLNNSMKDIMMSGLKKDSLFTIIGNDRVHPGTTGHFIIFNEIISKLEKPSLISKISIDISQNDPIHSLKNCNIEEFKISENTISFKVSEKSLPFPTNKQLTKALSLISFKHNFNRQMLFVKGLEKNDYKLFIGEDYINTFKSTELKEGVNLSNYPNTSQNKKAKELQLLSEEYRKVGFELRIIPFINYKYLRDYIGTDNLADKRIYLDAQLMKIKQKPYYGYIKRSVEMYFKTIYKIDSLKIALTEISKKVNLTSEIEKNDWRLVKNQELVSDDLF